MGKKKKSRKITIHLSEEQTRIMMEQLLKAKTIPSAKIYNRKDKHPKKGDQS